MKVNWVRKVYANGRGWHVGSMVKWKGAYYICFVDGTGHGTEDSQIRISCSIDLENWTSQIAIGKTSIDPQLLPIGDELFLYAVTLDQKTESDFGFPSWEVVASTEDGMTWTKPKRCFSMNHDFWHPTAYGGRYYVACDNAGHVPTGIHAKVDLLTSEDGERWSWVSEIVHGTEEPEHYDIERSRYFGTPMPSETALCFFDDGRVLAVTRARGCCALFSTSDPPYERWEYHLSETSRCYGATIAKVGAHIVVTGRYFQDEADASLEVDGAATGVHLYEDGDIRLQTLLPSGKDTGYAGILPLSDNEALIAYYSSHEYPESTGSNVYLASVSLEA